jgi:hypothetical protein
MGTGEGRQQGPFTVVRTVLLHMCPLRLEMVGHAAGSCAPGPSGLVHQIHL